jgi:hypothetical protein
MRLSNYGVTMKVRILAAVAALALGTAMSAGAAHANTYYLTVDGCSNPPTCLGSNNELGKVTVTQNGNALDFSVVLDNGALFNNNNNGQHHAFVFDLNPGGVNLGTLNYTNFQTVIGTNPPTATTAFSAASGSAPYSDSPFGGAWTNAIDYNKGTNGNSSTNASNFSFQLTNQFNDLSLSMLTFGDIYNGSHIYVAADVFANGTTGNVGSTGGAVPEPASWALMIMGVGAIGAAMRQRRAQALTVA